MKQTRSQGSNPSNPSPPGESTRNKDAKTPCRIQSGTTISIARERETEGGRASSKADEHGAQGGAEQLSLAGIQADAESEKQQQQRADELDGEGGADADEIGEKKAAADLEVAGVGGGAQQQAGERGAGGLRGDVQHHAREGGQAREEGAHGDQRVHVPSGDGAEGVDQ